MERSSARTRQAAIVALTLALPTLLACRALVGLDDLRKGECPGAQCADDGGLVDVDVDAPVVDASDAGPDAPPGAAAVSWAQWPMPGDGVDAGTADGGPLGPDYTINSGESVTENITGLVWRRNPIDRDMTYEEAAAACRELDPSTGPWRLPKRIELVTLLDFGQASSLAPPLPIDTTTFPGVKNSVYWTSSEVRPFSGGAYWSLNLTSQGTLQPLAATLVAKALCVKDTTP